MGGGASSEEKPKEEETPKPKDEGSPSKDAQGWEKKYNECRKELEKKNQELEAARGELKNKSGGGTVAKSSSKVTGGVSFQVICTREQIENISKMEKVSFEPVQGDGYPFSDKYENVILVTCEKDKVVDVIAASTCPSELEKMPVPKPDAPPKFGEEKKEEEEEEEKPKIEVPEKNVPVATDINFDEGAWDGKLKLQFTWVNEPSPYSEFFDPSGSNWWNDRNIRKAPGGPPKEVTLQWRQGMTGTWADLKAELKPNGDGFLEMDFKPEEIKSSAYRGFQSRWIVDGDKYLSALQLAPTLQSKLMTYPLVRTAIKALPADKQDFAHIENETLRDALMAIENLIPQNTWDFGYGVTMLPGAFLNEEHILTFTQKISMIAKLKAGDPKMLADVRGALVKSPVSVASAGLGTLGVDLSLVVNNLDFFIPKYAEPNLDELENLESTPLELEKLRREMQVDVNGLYPQYIQGLRVSVAPAHALRNALKTKRPKIHPDSTCPITVSFECEKEEQFLSKQKVQFIYWRDEEDWAKDKKVMECVAEEKTEEFGAFTKESKQTWRTYKASLKMKAGKYKYYWTYNDAPYFNDGSPFTEKWSPPTSYHVMYVEYTVNFGIGVAF